MLKEGLFDHVIDDFAGGVEGASGFAGGVAGFGVNFGEEIFENAAKDFWVNGDFGVECGIFVDGEVVHFQGLEKIQEPVVGDEQCVDCFRFSQSPFFVEIIVVRVEQAPVEVWDEVGKCGRVFAALVHRFVQGLEEEFFEDGVVVAAMLFDGFG